MPALSVIDCVNVVGDALAGYFGDQFWSLANQRPRTFVAIDRQMRPQLGMNSNGVASFTAVRGNGKR